MLDSAVPQSQGAACSVVHIPNRIKHLADSLSRPKVPDLSVGFKPILGDKSIPGVMNLPFGMAAARRVMGDEVFGMPLRRPPLHFSEER